MNGNFGGEQYLFFKVVERVRKSLNMYVTKLISLLKISLSVDMTINKIMKLLSEKKLSTKTISYPQNK